MKSPQDIINDSGYPLQLCLEEIINDSWSKHYWNVIAKEHRWINNKTNEEGFIDLILGHKTYSYRLVVECKRLAGSWNFLLPTQVQDHLTGYIRTLNADYNSKQFYWQKGEFYPRTFESMFCVPEIEGKKDNRTIEKIAGELLLSIESLAKEELNIEIDKKEQAIYKKEPYPGKNLMCYIPIIVTTSKLKVCRFNPKDISSENGELNESKFEDIEFIRFCKNFATDIKTMEIEKIKSLEDSNKQNNRTVFIVQACKLLDFLIRITREN
jgi:hypothetical protein